MSKKEAIQGLLNRNPVRPTTNTDVQEYRKPIVQKAIKKATFEMDAELHMWLKLYAVKTGKNMVNVVEDALLAYRKNVD